MKKFNKSISLLCVFAFLSAGLYAQSTVVPVDIGVDPADTVASIATVLGTAIAAAFGLAVTIFAVMSGWRKIKSLARG